PRRALYITKLLATYLLVAALAGLFAVITMIAVHWGSPGFWGEILPGRALQVALLGMLTLVAYCSIFGLIRLFTRWSLVAWHLLHPPVRGDTGKFRVRHAQGDGAVLFPRPRDTLARSETGDVVDRPC